MLAYNDITDDQTSKQGNYKKQRNYKITRDPPSGFSYNFRLFLLYHHFTAYVRRELARPIIVSLEVSARDAIWNIR